MRGRLEGLGPTTAAALAASLGLPVARIDAALATLQAEGFAMRGAFTAAAAAASEWCERRLLARIHRYTVKRLRAEIEPIEARDFLRFLFEWQRVTPAGRMEGPDAVGAILAQLEGFEAPAGAWETEVLPNRISEYEPAWLDEQCLAGRFVWTRLAPRRADPERGAAPVRATPIVLLARRNVRLWSSLTGVPEAVHLSAAAQRVGAYLTTHGASFFDEIAPGSGLLPTQAEEALAELVALGLVNSDSFAGLRALLLPAERRRGGAAGRRRRRIALFGMDAAGRWSKVARAAPGAEAGAGARGGNRRARRAYAAAPLGRGVLEAAGARGGLAAAVARPAHVLPPARGARGDPRRALHRRLQRRAVRGSRGDRAAARCAPQAARQSPAGVLGRRPAEPRRHSHPRCAPAFAQRQPRAVPRRRADRAAWRVAR